uniref:Protein Flattop n=1 Tax=Phallusia mammillata TaxID=59560 RepID=A0A6F9D7A1_9ASCI|nr:UPF0740 protein C1orf192-like [Phallusia mammillata]
MSSHFSANQYEDAFNPKKLKNWTVPRKHKERPSTLDGFTQIIATDRGHLKSAIPRSTESPWGTFMGTWDMPRNIPPARPSYTARSARAANNLLNFKETSPLNNAVNGYKEFSPGKPKRVITPRKSPIEKAPQPSGAVTKSPKMKESCHSPASRKSASPRIPTPDMLDERLSPESIKAASPELQNLSPPLSERSASNKSQMEYVADAC